MYTRVTSLLNGIHYIRFENKLNKPMNIIIIALMWLSIYNNYTIYYNILNIMHILYTSIAHGK